MVGKSKQNKTAKKNNISRKDYRKQFRKEKKARKNEYYKNKKKLALIKSSSALGKGGKENKTTHIEKNNTSKKITTKNAVEGQDISKQVAVQKTQTNYFDEQNKVHKKEMKEKQKLEKGMRKMRKKQLIEANKEEDREIKKLEKQLKLNKRKSKTIPQSFADEGLDYLLEICDSDKLKEVAHAEMHLQESGSEFEDDFALVTGQLKRKVKLNTKSQNSSKKSTTTVKATNDEPEHSSELSSEDDTSLSEIDSSDNQGEESSDNDDNKMTKDFEEDNDEESDSKNDLDDFEDDNENYSDAEFGSENNSSNDGADDSFDDEGIEMEEDEKEKGKENNRSIKVVKDDGTWEDIYGRLRDKKGNIVKSEEESKYVPPHLRAQQMAQSTKNSEQLARLQKQLKGLVNRLAESNMHNIAGQIDELYMRNSRNDMNDSLLSLTSEALVSKVITPERLVMEHTLLIAVLHANVGMEVGAHFLQHYVQKFDKMFKEGQGVENKELDNVLLILCHMYNFKMFHSVLIYNILDLLSDKFTEKEVELILLVLRSVGFSLRKDDPLALKNLVLTLQKKGSESSHLKDNTRVRFMLDTLLAVKNNNMAKIPQYDPSHSEHLKKLLKNLVHKGKYVTELKVTLEDLLKVDERGRWWIVGSAWTGASTPATTSQATALAQESQYSQTVLDLARKQRMNTDTRRNIFCIIMTAEDYLDAFEKLLRLGLKAQQEQDIIHVMVHCLMQEKKFNPYYAHLATQFCQANRKYQMTIQYHLWDKLKELSKLSNTQISNLAKFLAHLFLEKALPISALKVMQFSEMDKPCVRLLRQVLLSLLLSTSAESMAAVFSRVSRPEKLHMFRESLRLFMHHFVLRNVSDLPEDQAVLLKDRVKMAETALASVDTSRKYL